ncbi:MAG: hypothetical protein PHP03_03705, partial [Candidatus Pacebacteria bacterium]|nr:hypothetical protein [Candidatus Paceibacterota bacterium]
MFIGNQHLIGDFKKLAGAGKLAHGYIFFGEPQSGKLSFARCLANFLENGEFDFPKRVLSDTLVVNEDGKESGIDFMRELKSFLFQTSIVS